MHHPTAPIPDRPLCKRFLEYFTQEDADRAVEQLDGKELLGTVVSLSSYVRVHNMHAPGALAKTRTTRDRKLYALINIEILCPPIPSPLAPAHAHLLQVLARTDEFHLRLENLRFPNGIADRLIMATHLVVEWTPSAKALPRIHSLGLTLPLPYLLCRGRLHIPPMIRGMR